MYFKTTLYKSIDLTQENIMFFVGNSKISKYVNNKLTSNLENKKSEYIYLLENLGFSNIGQNNININKDDIYLIEFTGEVKNCTVELFIISYSDKIKLNTESVKINEKLYLYPNKEAKSIRLAIRVTGEGEFSISDIKIYKAEINKPKNYKNITNVRCMKDLKVACIFDDFTMNCFKEMVKTIPLTPYNWKEELITNKPHILIVESAWEGKDRLWHRKIAADKYGLSILEEITSWCRENNIPSMFWNKEDPVHFNSFINACKLFDYIFTTDEGTIDRYKQTLRHDRVYTMPFACQPTIHNPIKFQEERIKKACFAGTYYGKKFKERKIDTDNILDASIKTIGLDIYDRHLGLKSTPYKFPDKYQEYIKGNLKPYELYIANKGYKITLNVNSVKDSNTMFSRRVFESIASGTPVVSSYSKGIEKIFGDLVLCSDDFNVLKNELEKLKNDETYYKRKVIKGIRLCMSKHTYQSRLEYMLDKANINLGVTDKSVTLIAVVNSELDVKNILDIYNKQTYVNKKLVLILKDKLILDSKIDFNNKFKSVLWKENMDIQSVIDTDYISYINLKNFYGKYYIEDLINASKYCEAEFIGKKSYLRAKKVILRSMSVENSNCEFEYVNSLDLDKCVFESSILNRFRIVDFIEYVQKNKIDLFKYGCRYFSIDRYNLIEDYFNLQSLDIENIEI